MESESKLGDGIYAVERLVNRRFRNGRTEYEVKWRGYDQTSWEPVANIMDNNLVRQFELELQERSMQKGRRGRKPIIRLGPEDLIPRFKKSKQQQKAMKRLSKDRKSSEKASKAGSRSSLDSDGSSSDSSDSSESDLAKKNRRRQPSTDKNQEKRPVVADKDDRGSDASAEIQAPVTKVDHTELQGDVPIPISLPSTSRDLHNAPTRRSPLAVAKQRRRSHSPLRKIGQKKVDDETGSVCSSDSSSSSSSSSSSAYSLAGPQFTEVTDSGITVIFEEVPNQTKCADILPEDRVENEAF